MSNFTRRDILKGLSTLPVLGLFGLSVAWEKNLAQKPNIPKQYRAFIKQWGVDIHMDKEQEVNSSKGDRINIGIIGFGWQGEQLAKGLGFVHPSWIKKCQSNPENREFLQDFLSQYDLNVRIAGMCDLYKPRAKKGVEVSQNDTRPGGGSEKLHPAKQYGTYKELLADTNIDAVIIATPDFWHATMVKEAVAAGKHVYCEKPMTIDIQDAKDVHKLVKESGIVFQLGHQNYQQTSHIMANDLYKKGAIGDLNLVEFTANRYRVGQKDPKYPAGAEKDINWEAFQEILPVKRDFDPHRFFNWYHFLDYGIGVAGTMLTHEYASANQILDMGIPDSVIASGGRYVSKFKGEIPDVFNAVFEYKKKKFSFLYSITYGNSSSRGRWIMGNHGSMQVGSDVMVYPEKNSKNYPGADPFKPVFHYTPLSDVDAVSSATQKYFAKKGLMYTYRYGKRLDTIHLHLKEWIDCIRNGGRPSCNIDLGFEEAVTCVMAHQSFLNKKTVEWDGDAQKMLI
jgi:predicted dehydrogenase